MKIYLDFDGTVVEHQYPDIGKYNVGAFEVIRKLQDAGHEIILNTYRADCNDGTLEAAQLYLKMVSTISKITKFEKKKIEPHSWDWDYFITNDLIFIDDICKNIPLKSVQSALYDVVDWNALDREFEEKEIYKRKI